MNGRRWRERDWCPWGRRRRRAQAAALDSAYRERARLVAYLARVHGARWFVPQRGEPWWVVYVQTPAGQLSWHVHERDRDVFPAGIEVVDANPWDGHDTSEKYRRLAALP